MSARTPKSRYYAECGPHSAFLMMRRSEEAAGRQSSRCCRLLLIGQDRTNGSRAPGSRCAGRSSEGSA